MARLIDFRLRVAEPGRIVMELEPHESLENTVGLLHGATAAALLDTAMGCAISTMLPAGQGSVTLDLKLTYLRPLSVRSGTISAEGKLIKLGRQTSYAEGFVRDGSGHLSVRLREKGAHGIGVADLMKDAGLTHGGFYAHFDSREALVIEAFTYAMDRSTERWRKLAEATPPEKRLAVIVDSYLTQIHRDDPGHGCSLPTLGPEIARESPKTRKAFAAKLDQMIEMLADQIPELPRKAARKQAVAAIATMLGTLVLARIAGSGEFSDEILAAGRDAAPGNSAPAKPAKKSRARPSPAAGS
jgi:TetR/AcrR family transcriptional repressor of nem operon